MSHTSIPDPSSLQRPTSPYTITYALIALNVLVHAAMCLAGVSLLSLSLPALP